MNAVTPPPPDRRGLGSEVEPGPQGRALLAVLATVLYFALLIFVYGFLALLIDRDVIREPDAGPFVGAAMVVTACAIVFALVYRRQGTLGRRAATAALGAALVAPAVGALVYAFARAELLVIPVFFGGYILSPFVLSSAVLAAAVVAGAGLVERRA